MAKRWESISKGDRVKLTSLAKWRHLGYGIREGMIGTVASISKTRYGFLGKYKPHFTSPEKMYWIRLDSPTAKMIKKKVSSLGCSYDRLNGHEFKLVRE